MFNRNNIAKNINSLSTLDPLSGIYVTRMKSSLRNNLRKYVHRLHGGPLFSVPICILILLQCCDVITTMSVTSVVVHVLNGASSS